ncbi:hypothetical protein ACFS07_36380 [Undibacterium arcticum]
MAFDIQNTIGSAAKCPRINATAWARIGVFFRPLSVQTGLEKKRVTDALSEAEMDGWQKA